MPTVGEIAENAFNEADAAAARAAAIAVDTINKYNLQPLDIMLLCLICHAVVNAGISSPEYSALAATSHSVFHEWVIVNRVSIGRQGGVLAVLPIDFSTLPTDAARFFEHEFTRITQERQITSACKDACQ
jgi:hypothetical protein